MLGNIVQKNALRVREATTKCLMSDIPIDESEADYMQSADQRLEDEAIVDQAIAETVTSGFFARHLPMLLSCACSSLSLSLSLRVCVCINMYVIE